MRSVSQIPPAIIYLICAKLETRTDRIMVTADALLAAYPFDEVEAFYCLMCDYILDKAAYDQRLARLPDVFATTSNSRQLWSAGNFDLMMLNHLLLMHPRCSGGVNDRITRILVRNSNANSLIMEAPSQIASFWWNRESITDAYNKGILRNYIIDRPEYIVECYRPAVLAISVEKGGDQFIGTGFICAYDAGRPKRHFVVTAKHNVDPAEGIKIL